MRYRWQEVFSLGRWSSLLPPGFLVSRGTQAIRREGTLLFAYGAITLSGVPFQDTSAKQVLCNFPLLLWKQDDGCLQPPLSNGHSLLHPVGLGFSPFARRYLGNRCCFLFLGLLRCFSSPGAPRPLTRTVTQVFLRRVSPFGDLRIIGCSHLPGAFRRLPRPSSASCPKASSVCPY